MDQYTVLNPSTAGELSAELSDAPRPPKERFQVLQWKKLDWVAEHLLRIKNDADLDISWKNAQSQN